MSHDSAEGSTSTLGRVRSIIGLRTRIRRARHHMIVGRAVVTAGHGHFSRSTVLRQFLWSLRRPSLRRIDAAGVSVLARFGRDRSDLFIWHEIFSENEYGVVDLADPHLILDVGGNVGYAAVWFAERYPNARIITIEPDADNYEVLLANVADEPRIHPIRAAVASAGAPRQQVMPGVHQHGGAGIITRPIEDDTAVVDPASIVDSIDVATILDQFGIDRLDLLKIDVEGAEIDILGHSGPWIDRVDAIVAELHEWMIPGCEEVFAAATAGFGSRTRVGSRATIDYVRRESPSLTA